MPYKVGDQISVTPYTVYLIESAMPTAQATKWQPLSIMATNATRKYKTDQKRCLMLGMIRLDNVIAYIDVGVATKVFTDISASTPAPHQLRLVKMEADFNRFYQAGADS